MPKVSGFCRTCGREITFYPSQPRASCSYACDREWRRRTNNPRKPRRGTTTPCQICGKPVYATAYLRAKGQGRYCSQACHNISQTKPAVIKPCRVCGKEMRHKPSQAAVATCSRACHALSRIKRPMNRIHNGKPAKTDKWGYVMLWEPDHPNQSLRGWQYEHRLIAEKKVGRLLRSDEQVDHINGIKNDNRPANLQVLTAHQHSSKTSLTNWKQLAEYRRRYGGLDTN